MKIQIDTIRKEIKIEESVNVNDFFDTLESFLPNGLWKEFTLETNVINNWINPIVIKEYPVYPSSPNPILPPFTPTWQPNPPYRPYPWIDCGNPSTGMGKNDFTCVLAPGVFNVEYSDK